MTLDDSTFLLHGQSTDGGGGGVLDGLSKELHELGLTVDQEDYLVASCSIHDLQLTLCNPTKKLLGEVIYRRSG